MVSAIGSDVLENDNGELQCSPFPTETDGERSMNPWKRNGIDFGVRIIMKEKLTEG